MSKLTFTASAEARLLAVELRKLQPGELVTYKVLSDAVAKKVVGNLSCLRTARKTVEKELGCNFGVVENVGVKRLLPAETVDEASAKRQGLSRQSRRALQRLARVDPTAELPAEKQLQHTTNMTILSAIQAMSSEKAVKKVEAAVGSRTSELPIADTLRIFQEKEDKK